MTILSGSIADAAANPINCFLRIQLLQPLVSGISTPKKVSLPIQFDLQITNGVFSVEIPESETKGQVYSFSLFKLNTTISFYYDNGDFYAYDGELPYVLNNNEYYVGYVYSDESPRLNKKITTEEIEIEPTFFAAIPNRNSVDFADLEKTGFWNDRIPQTAKQVADILKKDPAFLATIFEIVVPTTNYSNTQLYRVGNTVLYNSLRYVCKDDGVVGILPSNLSKWIPVDTIFSQGGGNNPDGNNYELPIATTSTLGGVIVGEGLNIDNAGFANVDISHIQQNIDLELPVATTSTLGCIIVGSDFNISGAGLLSLADTAKNKIMPTTLAPQFESKYLDLELKKGESAQFSIAVSDYDLDLRGCSMFAEIRRLSPGYNPIPGVTGTVINGTNVIQIKRYPFVDDNKARLLALLPVYAGDLITLEGSGILASKVIAVTDSQINSTLSATRTISEGRLLVRSLSLTSFTAIPYLPNITISLTASASIGATSINVANVTRTIPKDTILVFSDGGIADPVTLTADLVPGSTIAYTSSTVAIASGSTAIVGASTVIVTTNAAINATSIAVSALSVPMPANTVLNFATRNADGWQYVGSATLTAAVLAGATSITVAALSVAIPQNAIAWFGAHTFNSFILAIDPADTQFLESGDYGYDVICRQSDGYTIRLIQGNVKLTDHWSDGV